MTDNFTAKFNAVTQARIEALGLRKSSAAVFVGDLDQGVLRWVGLNRIAGSRAIHVNPVVGVRLQQVEYTVAKTLGERFHPCVPPTVSAPLRSVAPEQTGWDFAGGADLDPIAHEMANSIRDFGFPWMDRHSTFQNALRALEEEGLGLEVQNQYRIPVLKVLLGLKQDARKYLESAARRMRDRIDVDATRFLEFADKIAVDDFAFVTSTSHDSLPH